MEDEESCRKKRGKRSMTDNPSRYEPVNTCRQSCQGHTGCCSKNQEPWTLDNLVRGIYEGTSNVIGMVSTTAKRTFDDAADLTLSVLIGYYSGWAVEQIRNTLIGKALGLDAGLQAIHDLSGARADTQTYAVLGAGIGIATYIAKKISRAWKYAKE